jgi:hypothetical protein
MNVKPKIRIARNPKENRSPKSEAALVDLRQKLPIDGRTGGWFRISGFVPLCGISAFGIRPSGFMLVLVIALMLVPAAQAQPNTPHLGYVYPAGGRQGTTFQVVVGGQFLVNVTNAFVSGAGIQTKVIEYNRPLNPKEFNDLRDRLKMLQDKRQAARRDPNSTNTWTAVDEKEFAEIMNKIIKNPPNRQGNPAIAETVIVQATLATNAEPGERDLRLETPAGLSNPLIFRVGQLPEFSRPAAKAVNPDLDSFLERLGKIPATNTASETSITLPAVVNGQIMPGGVDWYRFQARKGQRLVVAVSARELIPYLADAVPGWFQAAVSLFDAQGKELDYADHYWFHPDPVLFCEIPKDGIYLLQVRDSLYRGREDFVYRIALGELPLVTGVFPLGGPAGAQTPVELTGWNLPVTNLTEDATGKEPGIYPLSISKGERIYNHQPFALDTLPECLEQEPNDSPETAQAVTLPVIVNGRIDHPGDWDVFRFEGKTGDPVVAEVSARRLDSPLDSVLKLTDAGGKQLAFNDDNEDKGSGLNTHHADSYISTGLPTNGTYYLWLGDIQHKGGPEYSYRLRLSPPQADFALRVVPSSLNVRAGGSVPLTVYALRKDGFTNQITLVLDGAPDGFKLTGDSIPAGQNQVQITLTAPPTALPEPVSLNIEGCAMIQGRVLLRKAVPAEDMMQAFAYRHLVPVKELEVAVLKRPNPRAGMKILSATPVRILPGGTARIQVGLPAPRLAERAQFELSNPPEGITIQNVSPVRDGVEIVLQTDAAKVKPGLKGNLIINGFAPRPVESGAAKPKANNNQRMSLGALPAIPFEIIPP